VLENRDSSGQAEAIETLVRIVRVGYEATDQRPIAVYVESAPHSYYIGEAECPPFTAESLAHDGYHHLSWLTVFTPPMVERYGRETLLSAPAWKVEKLDDGGVLIVSHGNVAEWQEDGRAVANHIGLPWYEDIA